MTKRLLAMVLVCILAIPILAVPASATSADHVTINDFNQFATALGNLLTSIEDDIITWLYQIRLSIVDVTTNVCAHLQTLDDNVMAGIDNLGFHFAEWFTLLDSNQAERLTLLISNLETLFDNLNYNINTWWHEHILIVGNIRNRIETLIKGQTDLDPDIDKIGDDIAEDKEHYKDNMGTVQDATRPVYDDVYIGYEGLVNDPTAAAVYGSLLSLLFQPGGYFYQILFVAFTFSMVSFVVFGKR